MSVYTAKKGTKKFIFLNQRTNVLKEIPKSFPVSKEKEVALFKKMVRGPIQQVNCMFRTVTLIEDGFPKDCNIRGNVMFDQIIDTFISVELSAEIYSLDGSITDENVVQWKISDGTKSSNFFHVGDTKTVSLHKKKGIILGFSFPKPVEAVFSIRFTITFGLNNLQKCAIRPFYLKAHSFKKTKKKTTKAINLVTDERIWIPKLLQTVEQTPLDMLCLSDDDMEVENIFDELHGYNLNEVVPLDNYTMVNDV